MTKVRHPELTGLHVRVVLRNGGVLGPGRASLLEGIRDLGSIAAAGRSMGMSYRRAWTLVEDTNRAFAAPLVAAAAGGAQGGCATLTDAGEAVLRLYRLIEAKAAAATAAECHALETRAENKAENAPVPEFPT